MASTRVGRPAARGLLGRALDAVEVEATLAALDLEGEARRAGEGVREAIEHEAQGRVGLRRGGRRQHHHAEVGAVRPEEALAPGESGELVRLGGAERVLSAELRTSRGAARAEDRHVVLGRVRGDAGEAEDVGGDGRDGRRGAGRVEIDAAGADEASERRHPRRLEAGEVERERVEGFGGLGASQRGADEGAHAGVEGVAVGRGEHRAPVLARATGRRAPRAGRRRRRRGAPRGW